MPSHRVADAAHIAPYLTHAVSHHGQVTLIPPDNAGRVRQGGKPKKNRSTPRPERNARPEEDLRFNTGPRSLRTLVVNRGGHRPTRQDRGRDEGFIEEAYPDYPPPSFLEAISSPSSSVYPSTATLVSQPVSAAAQNTVPSTAPLPTHPSPFLYQQSSLSSPSQTCRDYDAESDSSLDFVEREPGPDNGRQRLEEGVRRDWRDRRGVEFPSPPGNPRGRTKSRGRAILDSDPEDIVDETQPPEPVQDNAKRRHMSLSPLRTFFPYRPMGVFDRALSAHPSPNSSPYSSNSSSPFLSTTSLKMTMSTTSFSTSMRSENFLSRKFLSSFKGKERVASNESWDDWEEITVQEAPPVLTSPVARKEKISVRPQTLPNGDRPLTSGTTPETPTTPAETAVSSGSQSPHPLSLRDRKAPPVPFVSRPVRRPAPPPPVLNPVATPLGPIVTSVRTRKANPPPPPPKKKPQVIGASPLGRTLTDEADSESSSILQRALVTPLPLTPIDARHFEYGSITPITPTSERLPGPNFPSALTPVGPSPLSLTTLNRAPGQNTLPALIEPPNETLNYPILETPTEEGSTTLISPSDGAQSFRRHYPGRPLPRPPGTTRAVVDSVYASRYNPQASGTGSALSTCPEGLLIDFGDASLAVSETNAQDHPWNDSLHVPFSATASMSSVELSGSTLDDPFSLPLDAPIPSTPAAETPTTQPLAILPATQITTAPPTVQSITTQAPTPVSTGPFSEITDLDVLVSRLDEEHRNGSNYDALLLLSEFIGPASPRSAPVGPMSPARPSAVQQPSENPPPAVAVAPENAALLANVEVERRRTTKDGRVKLKLILMDASVDRCGICLMQFKSGELARLGSVCRHAFHDKCLGRWLIRSKTCPMCRVPLVDPTF